MKLKLTWLMTLFMALVIQISFAQEKSVSGTITSANDGFPLAGVNVIVKGTTRGVQSDFDGNYAIKASANETIVFSFVGLKTVEMKVGSGSKIDVKMEEDANALEEVVVVGYAGATNSSKITSALSVVTAESIEQIPISSVDQMLQGQAAGVNVSTGSGQPGQSATIIIRGRNSLNGDTEPMFIIDGVPVDQDNFRSLNQNDIASLSVLKDAAATAIYGNRGAGGVILITTKTGAKGSGVKVQYRSLFGVSDVPSPKFNVMSSRQFLTFQKDMVIGNQYGDGLTYGEIDAISLQTNTDWTDILLRQGQTVSHEVNVTTGGENSSSFSSINYFEQEGTTLGSDLKRFSFRNNFNANSKDGKFNFSTTFTGNYSVSSFVVDAVRGANTGGNLDNPFIVPYIGLPYISPYNPDGSINIWGTGPTSTGGSGAYLSNGDYDLGGISGFKNSPFIALNTAALGTDQESEIKIVGRIAADYNFAKNLTAGTSFGLDYTNEERLYIRSPKSIRGMGLPNEAALNKGTQFESFYRDANFISNVFVRYDNDITEKFNLNAAVFGEYNYSNTQVASYQAYGLNPALPGSGDGFTDGETIEGDNVYNYIPSVGSSENELALASVFATLDLDYDSRFGISGSVRNDASSRFVENRDGVFWSVSGRWNVNNESFMQNVDWLNILKFRISYGVVGNQDLGANRRYIGLQTVAAGSGYQLANDYQINTLIDPAIKWETSKQFNVGMSFGLWQNRLSGELDYYRNLTSDLFANKLLSPAGTGYSSVTTNVAEMSNRGVDLQLSYAILRQSSSNHWGIKINANANYNKNNVESFPGGFTGGSLRIAEGYSANTWFLQRWAGVNPANGEPLYLDADGNITNEYSFSKNAVYTGKNFDPTYTGGFGAEITYKGFALNSLFSFQADRYKLNSSLALIEDIDQVTNLNMSTTMLDSWTTPGQITSMPALSYGGIRGNSGDRYLEDASFLRLRNISLSYSLSSEVLERTNVFTGFRVFVQGTNLVTWTKYRGFDPEGTTAQTFFEYPVARTVSLGFDLTF